MDKEIITFIVPAYNSEATLSTTIESILRQTSDSYKIIIVNDGSTDKTGEIGKKYEQNYPDKVRYLCQKNRGLGGARNHGMDLADTPYIAFIDSDDWIKADYVENITKQIENNKADKPEVILILPEIYDENSKLVSPWYDKQLFERIFPKDGVCVNPQKDKRIYRTDVNQCRKVLQTKFVKKINFRFREHVKWEDICPHFYLLTHCRKCMGVGSVGFYYRKGSAHQITASRGKDRMDLIIVYKDLLPYLCTSDKELIYPVMHIMVSFANEGVKIADTDIRRKLVVALHYFFKEVPKRCDRILYQQGKRDYSKSEMRQYHIFLNVIRRRLLLIVFYDYLYRDASEQLLKKMIRLCLRKLRKNETNRELFVAGSVWYGKECGNTSAD